MTEPQMVNWKGCCKKVIAYSNKDKNSQSGQQSLGLDLNWRSSLYEGEWTSVLWHSISKIC